MNRRISTSLCVAASALASVSVWAQETNYFDAGVSVSSEYTNNAFKRLDDKVSERQDRYMLRLGSAYVNPLIEFDANYRATHHQFNRDTQSDRSLWEGDANLLVGKAHHRADVLFSHTRRARLNAPGQVDLLQNTDEQQIFTVAPSLRHRFSSVDTLVLRGNYSEVDYRFAEERNSSRQGASLVWLHQLSRTDSLETSVQYMEVEFDAAPDFDYTYQAARIAYSTQLRAINYRVEVGYNESEREQGEGFSGLSYALDARYVDGYHTVTLRADQYITDTSMGGRNGPLDEPNFGGVNVTDPDQLERSSVELRWQANILCARCDLNAGVLFQQDEYRELNEDSDEIGARLGFGYTLSEPATINVTFDSRNFRYATGVPREDHRVDRLRIEYRYSFLNDLSVQLYGAHESRSQDTATSEYSQAIVGLALDYDF